MPHVRGPNDTKPINVNLPPLVLSSIISGPPLSPGHRVKKTKFISY